MTAAYGAAAAQLTASRSAERPEIVRGPLLLVAGLVLIEASVPTGSLVAFLVGATVAGLGHGLTFKASLAFLDEAMPPDRKGEAFSRYYVCAYVGTALPVLGVGFAAGTMGLYAATVAFAAVIGASAVVALARVIGPGP